MALNEFSQEKKNIKEISSEKSDILLIEFAGMPNAKNSEYFFEHLSKSMKNYLFFSSNQENYRPTLLHSLYGISKGGSDFPPQPNDHNKNLQ